MPHTIPEGTLATIPFASIDPYSANSRWPEPAPTTPDEPPTRTSLWDRFPADPDTSPDAMAWRALRDTIRAEGVLQPPHVMALPDDAAYRYQVLWGFRRLVAAYHAEPEPRDTATIAVLVHPTLEATTVRAAQWIENARRQDLPWLETARTIRELADQKWPQKEIARTLGISQGLVNGYLQMAQPLADQPELRALAGEFLGPSHVQRIVQWSRQAWAQKVWAQRGLKGTDRLATADDRAGEVIAWVVEELRKAAGQLGANDTPNRNWANDQLNRLERILKSVKGADGLMNPQDPTQPLDTTHWDQVPAAPKVLPVAPWIAQTQQLVSMPEALAALNDEKRKALRAALTALLKALH